MVLALALRDVVLWVHISAVVIGFGVVFTYPLWFAALRGAAPAQRALFHRVQAQIGRYVISPALLVIVLAGAYLASEQDVWSETWVAIPFLIAIALGGLGGAYLNPREKRLAALAEGGGGAEYDATAARVKTATYVSMVLVLVAAFFMVTKLG